VQELLRSNIFLGSVYFVIWVFKQICFRWRARKRDNHSRESLHVCASKLVEVVDVISLQERDEECMVYERVVNM